MAKYNSEEINFKTLIDGVKQKEISWKFFTTLIQNLSYSDINKLRILNAILLTELTMNYSDIDKMKYLNEILMIQFKNHIQREHADFEMTENDHLEDSHDTDILNEETIDDTINEISTNEEHNFEMSQNEDFENNGNQLLNEETTKEISKESEIQVPSETNAKIFCILCYKCDNEIFLH
jgi:hypothetical protein